MKKQTYEIKNEKGDTIKTVTAWTAEAAIKAVPNYRIMCVNNRPGKTSIIDAQKKD